MRRVTILFLFFTLVLGMTNILHATTLGYTTTNLGENRWEYIYSVSNDTLSSPIEEFTIYFDYGLYDNLSVDTLKLGWDPVVVNPDLILGVPEPGFYDALALVSGIAPGVTESGFQVSFDWLAVGIPGIQFFEVVNPSSFTALDSGNTVPVPEPGTLILLGSGLVSFLTIRKVRAKK